MKNFFAMNFDAAIDCGCRKVNRVRRMQRHVAKFFAALMLTLLVAATAFATTDGNNIAIGKIYPGMSANDLINAFGQPTRKDGDDWTYPTFKVEIERGMVGEISTRSETIATPNGVRVGLPATALNSTFGKADNIDDGDEYEYFSHNYTKKIKFKVSNGIITKITCEVND